MWDEVDHCKIPFNSSKIDYLCPKYTSIYTNSWPHRVINRNPFRILIPSNMFNNVLHNVHKNHKRHTDWELWPEFSENWTAGSVSIQLLHHPRLQAYWQSISNASNGIGSHHDRMSECHRVPSCDIPLFASPWSITFQLQHQSMQENKDNKEVNKDINYTNHRLVKHHATRRVDLQKEWPSAWVCLSIKCCKSEECTHGATMRIIVISKEMPSVTNTSLNTFLCEEFYLKMAS